MILRHIIHDWSDAEAIQILRNCRLAISDQGKLLLAEFAIKPSNRPDFVKWLDLSMLALLTGRERTKNETLAMVRPWCRRGAVQPDVAPGGDQPEVSRVRTEFCGF
jgi:hypothetical protein